MILRNAWYVAAWAADVSQSPLARRICNEPVVLFRDARNRAAALLDMCCHRGAPLSLGKVVEQGLECGYHGLTFDGSGACVRIPGQDRIPERARVRSFPVVEKDGFVWIWPGDPARADESLVIDYPYHNDAAKWPHKHQTLHIAANNMLMVDNLMDLTHLGYVHVSSIGGNPAIHVEARMETERTPRGLKFIRRMPNSVPPPTYVKAAGFKGRIDRWQQFEFIAPGSVVQWSGAADAGTVADADRHEAPFQFRLYHGLTPETETSCFYFWASANGYRQDDPATTEQLFSEIAAAFQEDKAVVEQQQLRMTELGEGELVEIAADAARMHMRRTVRRMIEEDASALAAE